MRTWEPRGGRLATVYRARQPSGSSRRKRFGRSRNRRGTWFRRIRSPRNGSRRSLAASSRSFFFCFSPAARNSSSSTRTSASGSGQPPRDVGQIFRRSLRSQNFGSSCNVHMTPRRASSVTRCNRVSSSTHARIVACRTLFACIRRAISARLSGPSSSAAALRSTASNSCNVRRRGEGPSISFGGGMVFIDMRHACNPTYLYVPLEFADAIRGDLSVPSRSQAIVRRADSLIENDALVLDEDSK